MSTRPAGRRSAKKKPVVRKKALRPSAARKPASQSSVYREFLAQARAMEQEAAERYDELADQMDVHNNVEVAALFRKMAEIERKHAVRVLGSFPDTPSSSLAPSLAIGQPEMPETVPTSEVHYLMPPYRALMLALESEQRAQSFFARIARTTRDARVRAAARELADEEREHVRLVKEWMKKVPKPDSGWDFDPDPPVYSD
ncbi:MAG: ferritin family protein [Betaproteobacteria bacterium]|nr:ferritin family protein [Betaproteobacteria bacterium]